MSRANIKKENCGEEQGGFKAGPPCTAWNHGTPKGHALLRHVTDAKGRIRELIKKLIVSGFGNWR